MDVSLNKYISDTGFCSRREADRYIEECRVTINGRDAVKGNRVKEGDEVRVDGERIVKKVQPFYIMLNKPKGITCTTDRSEPTNILDFVAHKHRIFPVGRLDKLSEGLIFLTNDGNVVNKILRAGNVHEKEYRVRVNQPITLEFIKRMRSGVRIPGAVTKKCFVKQEGELEFRIILTQGLNRQIRRMCEALGYKVTFLQRTRIMDFTLKGLAVGKWRYFTKDETAQLHALLKESRSEEM